MAKVTPDEIRSLSNLVSEIKNNTAEAQAQLEQSLSSGKKLSKQLEKDFKKIQSINIKGIRDKKKEIKVLYQEYEKLNAAQKKQLQQLEKEVSEMEHADTAIIKMTKSEKELTEATKALDMAMAALETTTTFGLSLAYKALDVVVGVLVGSFTNWIRLQELTREAQGRLAQSTGATISQFNELSSVAEGMRETFASLEGPIDGIMASYEFAQEFAQQFRTINDITPQLAHNILAVGRGFGVGTQNAIELFRLIQTGVAGPVRTLEDFAVDISDFAEDIGALPANLIRDFTEARGTIAQFGREGNEVFRRAAMMANHFGFETNRILEMMRGFDTFSQASTNVNQLNAMLGTTLSSFELMMEQDPTARLEMIRQALREQGIEWNSMSRQARQALSQMTGQSEDILARVFGDGMSFNDIQQQQASAASERERQQQVQISNQDRLNNMLSRTSVIFETWDRWVQGIMNTLSDGLSPVFDDLYHMAKDVVHSFADWLKEMIQSGRAQQIITEISTTIRGIGNWLRDEWPIYSRMFMRMWEQAQPTIKRLGEDIQKMFQFFSEHEDSISRIMGLFAEMSFESFETGLIVLDRTLDALEGISSLISRIIDNLNLSPEAFDAITRAATSVINPLSGIANIAHALGLISENPVNSAPSTSPASAPPAQSRATTSQNLGQQLVNSYVASLFPKTETKPTSVVNQTPLSNSAVSTAPIVSPTVNSRSPSAPSARNEIIVRDVIMDGRRVGQVFVENAQRT